MELEMQPEFDRFNDRLTSFELWKGKRTGDPDGDEKNFAGRFKVSRKIDIFYDNQCQQEKNCHSRSYEFFIISIFY